MDGAVSKLLRAILPDPDVLATEIVEDLQAALEQFNGIYEDLQQE